MRVLITGANGMIGRQLVKSALAQNWDTTAIILPGTSDKGLANARLIRNKSPDQPEMLEIFRRQDLVINLVGNMRGNRPQPYFSANVEHPRKLVTQLSRIPCPPKLIHVSSVAACGPSPDGTPLTEAHQANPVGVYGISKRQGEIEILKRTPGVPSLILRFPSLYGPEDPCFFDLFKWADKGFFPKLCTRTKQFNLLFCEDAIRLLIDVATGSAFDGKIINAGSNEISSDESLANALGIAAGRTLKRVFIPRAFLRFGAFAERLREMTTGELPLLSRSKVEEMSQPFWVHDFTRFQKIFGKPIATTLDEGISKTMVWYKQNKWL